MNKFVESKAVVAAIKVRISSKTRMGQILALSVGDESLYHGLRQALDRHLVSLNKPLVSAHVDDLILTFEGTEAEVLAKIRAIPLPKDGKKGTARTVLVKMVASRLARFKKDSFCFGNYSGWHPSLDELLEFSRNTMKCAGAGSFDERAAPLKKFLNLRRFAGGGWETSLLEKTERFFLRADVTEEILCEGYALWAVQTVHDS